MDIMGYRGWRDGYNGQQRMERWIVEQREWKDG